MLCADERSAFTATLAAREPRILSVHLNDDHGKRDKGPMVGEVHQIHTIEPFVEPECAAYDGVLFFDPLSDHSELDLLDEARTNIVVVGRLRGIAAKLV